MSGHIIEYLNITEQDKWISVYLANEDPKLLALGEKMNAVCPDAYMNGYNWDALVCYCLEKSRPDLLEGLYRDPEAGSCVFLYAASEENRKRAQILADFIISLVENEEALCCFVQEEGDQIEWD